MIANFARSWERILFTLMSQIVTKSRDTEKGHGIVFYLLREQRSRVVNQCYVIFYSILTILLPAPFSQKKLLSDKNKDFELCMDPDLHFVLAYHLENTVT